MDAEIVLAFIAVMSAIVAGSWLNAKSLKVREAESRRTGDEGRQLELHISENQQLNDRISFLEDRIAVLEQIVTDPAERTAREIERLR